MNTDAAVNLPAATLATIDRQIDEINDAMLDALLDNEDDYDADIVEDDLVSDVDAILAGYILPN